MRVLLISPLKELEPPGGDVTYTELLLEEPPEGAVYDTYDDALMKGTFIEHGLWSSAVTGPNAFLELFLRCFLRFVDWWPNPSINELYSFLANVLKHFNQHFSVPIVKPKLSMVYSRAINRVS